MCEWTHIEAGTLPGHVISEIAFLFSLRHVSSEGFGRWGRADLQRQIAEGAEGTVWAAFSQIRQHRRAYLVSVQFAAGNLKDAGSVCACVCVHSVK